MSNSGKLADQRALITGGASGIGLAVAEKFQAEGARVAICDASEIALADANKRFPEFLCIKADVSNEDAVSAMFDELQARFGGLEILVNNAGIAGPTAPLEDIDSATWDAVFAVNVKGTYLCTRKAIPLLKKQGGSIIIMSSAAGRFGVPMRTPYAATKWALIGLAKSLASELGNSKIRANAILPGLTSGARLDSVIAARAERAGRTFEQQKTIEVKNTPLGELVEAVDIANAALYLASSDGRMINGVALSVDGGLESVTFR